MKNPRLSREWSLPFIPARWDTKKLKMKSYLSPQTTSTCKWFHTQVFPNEEATVGPVRTCFWISICLFLGAQGHWDLLPAAKASSFPWKHFWGIEIKFNNLRWSKPFFQLPSHLLRGQQMLHGKVHSVRVTVMGSDLLTLCLEEWWEKWAGCLLLVHTNDSKSGSFLQARDTPEDFKTSWWTMLMQEGSIWCFFSVHGWTCLPDCLLQSLHMY